MRKILLAAAVVTILAAGAAAAWFLTHPREPEVHRLSVRETAREIAYLPHYVAAALGYFEDNGLHLNLTTAPRGVVDPAQEKSDLYLVPLDRLMVDGPVAFAALTGKDPNFLLGREAKPDFQWENLKQYTVIGDPPNAVGEAALEAILRRLELVPQTHVTVIQHLPVHLRVGTFLAGTGSYIILTDPMAAILEKAETGFVLASLAEAGKVPSRVSAATPEFLQTHPDIALGYCIAVFQAQEWIAQKSPAEIAVVAAPFFPYLDLETLKRVIARNKALDLWPANPLVEEDGYQNFQDWLIQSGELPQAVPFHQAVVPSFAREAVEEGTVPPPPQ
ncbi:MAG: hypothetical protein AB1402_09760 [Bacillota bacterium]